MNRHLDQNLDLETPTDQAVYWFALLLDGSETEEDRQAFVRWIEQDRRHLEAFNEVERLWGGTSSLHFPSKTKIGRRAFMAGSILAGVVATGWGVARYNPLADFHTSTGERREVSLPRGVKAMLASDTVLSMVSNGQAHGVELHRGEAWFEHGHGFGDFFVKSEDGLSWSRGGQFDVAHFDTTTTVTVADGDVRVQNANNAVSVAASHALTYDAGSLGPAVAVDIENALAWRNGQLVFIGERLGDVADILQRWQSGKIVILGDDVAARKVTMVVDLDRTRTVLPALADALSLRIDQFTDYLTIIRTV